ncbi:MAG: glycosyltransferase family 4 protein [Deltaproteobacteria bacterium]|nr:glycosyltransferase family 4 protein [Deltaproteobacteria bacterium]
MVNETDFRPLRVALLSYRSNPHCGGQGVYIKNLSTALVRLGHLVDVISGPPWPELDDGVGLVKLPSLDLYNPADLFRIPGLGELSDPVNLFEWLNVCAMGFPEPLTFSLRALKYLSENSGRYDVVHDNQCLGYGLWAISRFLPTVATIHHPITVDRDVAVESVRSWVKKAKIWRWYSFIGMQKRVSRKMLRLITVSECSKTDILKEFPVHRGRMRVVPNGINTGLFRPLPKIERNPNRVLVTNSADTPLKGLYYLLQAIDGVRKKRPVELEVVGTPKKGGGVVKLIRELGLRDTVHFTGRLSDENFVARYAEAAVAVVPSVYEGFGLPAGEAMSCGVPVISTTGGALPEVVGDAGVLVPPADPAALEAAIIDILDHPEKAAALGQAGFDRVHSMFTWKRAAEKVTDVYREAMRAHRPV